jgi:hypothetical protein
LIEVLLLLLVVVVVMVVMVVVEVLLLVVVVSMHGRGVAACPEAWLLTELFHTF